jgi:hypothetical protein
MQNGGVSIKNTGLRFRLVSGMIVSSALAIFILPLPLLRIKHAPRRIRSIQFCSKMPYELAGFVAHCCRKAKSGARPA